MPFQMALRSHIGSAICPNVLLNQREGRKSESKICVVAGNIQRHMSGLG